MSSTMESPQGYQENLVATPAAETVVVVSAPGLVVRLKNGNGYCATNISTCHKDGRWGLSFLCSGGLNFVPWDEVGAVEYYPADPGGRQHCDVCDGRLTAYPYDEADTGAVKTYRRDAGGNLVPETP